MRSSDDLCFLVCVLRYSVSHRINKKTKPDRHSPSQIRWRSESFEFDANHSCFRLLWSVSSHFRIKYNNLSRKNVALAQRCAKNKRIYSRVVNLWGGKSNALSSSRCRMAAWRNVLLDFPPHRRSPHRRFEREFSFSMRMCAMCVCYSLLFLFFLFTSSTATRFVFSSCDALRRKVSVREEK